MFDKRGRFAVNPFEIVIVLFYSVHDIEEEREVIP